MSALAPALAAASLVCLLVVMVGAGQSNALVLDYGQLRSLDELEPAPATRDRVKVPPSPTRSFSRGEFRSTPPAPAPTLARDKPTRTSPPRAGSPITAPPSERSSARSNATSSSATTAPPTSTAPSSTGGREGAARSAAPPETIALDVAEVATGLTHPWDTAVLPSGDLLVTQRPGTLTLVRDGQPRDVRADLADVYAEGEAGLMGLVLAPDFAESRTFVTCHSHQQDGAPVDNRLVRWRLSEDGASAERSAELLTSLPLNTASGRHSGCRPTFGPDGMLYVGTGDAAAGENPQDRHAMGGKVLRIDPDTGAAAPDNPFVESADEHEQRIFTLGHRNVQGVAIEPGTDRVWVAEHGPDVDDEITPLTAGGNGGWDPDDGAGSYDETVPMTDETVPEVMAPAYASGDGTEATSGAAFLGPEWGPDAGVLAVAALKGQRLLLMRTGRGQVTSTEVPPELDGRFGRLRSVRSESGALWITTDVGDNQDAVLRVTRR